MSVEISTASLAEAVSVLKRRRVIDSAPMETSIEAELCEEICDLLVCVEAYAEHGGSAISPLPLRAIGRLVGLVMLSLEAQEAGR